MINLLLIQQMPNEYLLYLDMGDLIWKMSLKKLIM